MMARLIMIARCWLSDADVQASRVEIRIALAQAATIGVPILLIAVGLMAAMP